MSGRAPLKLSIKNAEPVMQHQGNFAGKWMYAIELAPYYGENRLLVEKVAEQIVASGLNHVIIFGEEVELHLRAIRKLKRVLSEAYCVHIIVDGTFGVGLLRAYTIVQPDILHPLKQRTGDELWLSMDLVQSEQTLKDVLDTTNFWFYYLQSSSVEAQELCKIHPKWRLMYGEK